MLVNISKYVGQDAIEQISTTRFIREWQNLALKDSKLTVIQESAFVLTWYKNYQDNYDPLILLGYNGDNNLVGILPLAIVKKKNTIVHAGEKQGEYHGWIADQEYDNEFIIQCLLFIKNEFPILNKWEWRWLPPQTPTEWFQSNTLKKSGIFLHIESRECLLWDLEDTAKLSKLTKSKSNKAKAKRFKKRGNYNLEKITDPTLTREILKEHIQYQVDFRKLAINNVLPFGNDPNRISFFTELIQYPENNHFTVLWLDNRPLACHFGQCNNEVLILGLTSYDPCESKNSPGTLHLIELAKLLVSEGFKILDLTPGAHYKERFSNSSHQLYRPTIYFSKSSAFIGSLNNNFIIWLKSFSENYLKINSDKLLRIKTDISYWKGMIFNSKLKILKKILQRFIKYNKKFSLYRLHSSDINLSVDSSIHTQSYQSLMLYKDDYPYLSLRKMLNDSQKLFSNESILFSSTEVNTLHSMGWISCPKDQIELNNTTYSISIPPNSCVLHDFYTKSKTKI